MANADAAFGLRPIRYISGAPYNGAVNVYYVSDTTNDLFIGSPVSSAGTAVGGVEQVNAITVDDSTPTNNTPIAGVIVGFADSADGGQLRDDLRYVASGSTAYALVADDPNLLFLVQEDGNLGNAGVGAHYNLEDVGSGDTVTGLSGVQIDSSTATATDSDHVYNVRVVRVNDKPDNSVGTNANWEVAIVNHRAVAGGPNKAV